MGTDIHLYVERRNVETGKWELLPPPVRDLNLYPRTPRKEDGYVSPFWGPGGSAFYESSCYGTRDEFGDELACPIVEKTGVACAACLNTGRDLVWYRCRNYDVFSILADVRNGHGFAGIKTGDGFNVISQPRGLPDDISSELVASAPSWDHSLSWLLVSEMLAFNWKQSTRHTGVVPINAAAEKFPHNGSDADDYVAWKERGAKGAPKSWSGGISGGGIRTVDVAGAERILAQRGAPTEGVYVQITWEEEYAESASSFLQFMTEFLVPLGAPDAVRIVFGFDS